MNAVLEVVVNGEKASTRARTLAELLIELGYGGAKVATAGMPPTPEQAAEMNALRARVGRVGKIIAWHLVGAALLMQVETSFRILGYPGLAIISFLLAAAGGVALIVAIVFWDQ